MKSKKNTYSVTVRNVGELKRQVLANALATGNTFAFHNLFSCIKEFSERDDESGVTNTLLSHLAYTLPSEETLESPKFQAALDFVGKYELKDDFLPAPLLEETAKEAVKRGKFAYAEDAYRLLGIKKEMVALYAQTGEQFLRDDKPKHAALSFFVAAGIDQPIGPHYQYLGPALHARCSSEPGNCVTSLPIDALADEAIRFLLSNEALAERLVGTGRPEQKPHIIGALAVCRDMDLSEFAANLRAAVTELPKIDDGKPDDYSPIAPALLGRQTASGEAWQYLKELCFEHPIASLCVCVKPVRDTLVLVPVIREGKPLIDLLLPTGFLHT